MLSFQEVRLPLSIALGAVGGPERRTDIVTLGSGREERNAPWAHGRRRYDVGGGLRSLDDLHTLTAFFEARRGRLVGFRFRDFTDFRSCSPSATPSALDQPIGFGDGSSTAFSLVKTYGTGVDSYVRPIRKPVSGTVLVAVAGVALGAGAFSVDTTSGVVTLISPPAPAAAVTAGFEFDTPVRFDTDRLEASLDSFTAARPLSVPLIEILA